MAAAPRPFARSLRDPRVWAAAAGVALVAAAVGGWWLVLLDPAPRAVQPPFVDGRQPAPADGPYRVAGSYTVDGRTTDWSHAHAPGEPPVTLRRVLGDGSPAERVTYVRGNRSWTRLSFRDGEAYRSWVDARRDDPSLLVADDAARTAYVAGRDGAGPGYHAPFTARALALLGYARAGETTYRGRRAVLYEPTAGWATTPTERGYTETVYVRSVDGEVLVDAERGVVLFADVRATVVDADSRWGALTGDGTRVEVSHVVTVDADPPAEPPWVAGLNAAAGGNASVADGQPSAAAAGAPSTASGPPARNAASSSP